MRNKSLHGIPLGSWIRFPNILSTGHGNVDGMDLGFHHEIMVGYIEKVIPNISGIKGEKKAL